eukprot:5481449-Heterocapsa_arctica.AAC.1
MHSRIGRRGCPHRLLRQTGRGPQHFRGERPFGRLRGLCRRRNSLTLSLHGGSAWIHRKIHTVTRRGSRVGAG